MDAIKSAASIPPVEVKAETLELYEALDRLPAVERTEGTTSATRDAERESSLNRAVPLTSTTTIRAPVRRQTAYAAWWTSSMLHVVLLALIVLMAGAASLQSLASAGGRVSAPPTARERNALPETEVCRELTIPVALPARTVGCNTGSGNCDDATTILLELAFDRNGNARLVRAQTRRVSDSEVLALSCARISVTTSPGQQ